MNIEKLQEAVADEFTKADIIELASKACELKKQNDLLIESFECLVEVLEDWINPKQFQELGAICREQLKRITG